MTRSLAIIILLSTAIAATYGEMYQSLNMAKCVADPGDKCISSVPGQRFSITRCECTAGYKCQYVPSRDYQDGRFVCLPARSDSSIRKIFF